MSAKSTLYSGLSIVAGLLILVASAAKLYRGIGEIFGSGTTAKVTKLLEASDATAVEANRKLAEVTPAFLEILNDFDSKGGVAFRSEKREACAKVTELFTSANRDLQDASNSIAEAIKTGVIDKVKPFLQATAKSYDLKVNVNKQNINIVQALLDESLVDANTIVEKVTSLAAIRDADQKASDDAAAEASELLKRSKEGK